METVVRGYSRCTVCDTYIEVHGNSYICTNCGAECNLGTKFKWVKRKTMTTEEAVLNLIQELERAETKFPNWLTDIVHQIAVVAEEAGEALQAANNVRWHNGNIKEVRKELIQTGAMVLRALINLKE